MEDYYSIEHKIDYRSIDKNLSVTFPNFMAFLQETSINHADSIGYTMEWYKEKSMAFILTNWQIEVYKYPKYKDIIKVTTYPSLFKSILGERIFKVTDVNNDCLMLAKSRWIFMNLEKHKPIKIPEDMVESFMPFGDSPFENDFDIIKSTDFILKNQSNFITTKRDVDSNNHINNIKYLEWVMDLFDDETYYNHKIIKCKSSYKKECVSNSYVTIELFQNKNNLKDYIGVIKSSETTYCTVFFTLE